MAYFPAFLKFDDKTILIVGGGNIALEKLEHLLNVILRKLFLPTLFIPDPTIQVQLPGPGKYLVALVQIIWGMKYFLDLHHLNPEIM